MMTSFSGLDLLALCVFLLAWLGFDMALSTRVIRRPCLSTLMSRQRHRWMRTLASRDLRMIDTQILTGLQQGAAFFGSATIFALGGAVALFNATDTVATLLRDLPLSEPVDRLAFEVKVFGLSLILIYAFFKFAWSYRLFNYCSILIGAVPMTGQAEIEPRLLAAEQAADMNVIAGRHFTAGMRGLFFALAYLGWFIGAPVLIGTTLFVLGVLTRRQYFSEARRIAGGDILFVDRAGAAAGEDRKRPAQRP